MVKGVGISTFYFSIHKLTAKSGLLSSSPHQYMSGERLQRDVETVYDRDLHWWREKIEETIKCGLASMPLGEEMLPWRELKHNCKVQMTGQVV